MSATRLWYLGLALVAANAACGKKGDPLPPLRPDPQPVSDIRLVQRAGVVLLSFTAPRQTVAGQPMGVHDVDLLIADTPGDLKIVGRKETIRVAPGERIVRSYPVPAPGTVFRGAARVRAKGATSVLTPAGDLTVAVPPVPPEGVAAQNVAAGVQVTFALPSPAPPGYRLYRRLPDDAYGETPSASAAAGAAQVVDTTAKAGERWCYLVRATASTTPLVESGDSVEVCLDVVDRKAPAAPTGVAVLLREGVPEISWSPSPELDLHSYRVWRTPEGSDPVAVKTVPSAERTVHDSEAPAGPSLLYTVTATDTAGNESPPSEPVGITRPEVP